MVWTVDCLQGSGVIFYMIRVYLSLIVCLVCHTHWVPDLEINFIIKFYSILYHTEHGLNFPAKNP